MDYFRAAAISASGMLAQKARIEAAALNLANMNTTHAAGEPGFRPVTAVIHAQQAAFAQALAGDAPPLALAQAELVPIAEQQPRLAYEPGHPDADPNGMVAYPAVDHAKEMLTVTAALRTYEANLAVLQVTKTLAAKALEIGGQ
jgi:flagellar basal-body rod protein FlgC